METSSYTNYSLLQKATAPRSARYDPMAIHSRPRTSPYYSSSVATSPNLLLERCHPTNWISQLDGTEASFAHSSCKRLSAAYTCDSILFTLLCLSVLALSTPSSIRLTHVRWWLNRWDELGDNICDPNGSNDGSDNGGEETALLVRNDERSDEDVD